MKKTAREANYFHYCAKQSLPLKTIFPKPEILSVSQIPLLLPFKGRI